MGKSSIEKCRLELRSVRAIANTKANATSLLLCMNDPLSEIYYGVSTYTLYSRKPKQFITSMYVFTVQAASKEGNAIDVTITQDCIEIEDDSAEPQWFREIKREDEREHEHGKACSH